MDEIFLEDEETGLLVSNLGRVIGKSGKEISSNIDIYGYRRVYCINKFHIHRCLTIHRLVARNFIPNPLNLPQVNHRDENKLNNRVDNLEWCDAKYNNNYGTKMSRTKKTMLEHGITTRCTLVKDGIEISADSISEMARKIGTTPIQIKGVLNCDCSHVLGWHLKGSIPKKTKFDFSFELTNDADFFKFNSTSQASKIIGCSEGMIRRLLHGELKMCHGWHLPGVHSKKSYGPIRLTDGKETIEFKNLAAAARHFRVFHGIMSAVRAGRQKTIKGWRLVQCDSPIDIRKTEML